MTHLARLAATLTLLSLALAGTASAAPAPRSLWTVGGNGLGCASAPVCGDGGAATQARLAFPQGVAVDGAGTVFVADWGNNEIRRITPAGAITTVAGNGTACQSAPACGDGGPATSAQLAFPTAVALDARGDLFIADAGDDEIREVTRSGTITRVAGTGGDCPAVAPCGDGGPARSAALSSPDGIAVDRHGNLFIADTGDNRIRVLTPNGRVATVAGDGTPCARAPACGDGPATSAQLSSPEAVAVDARGRLLIADDGDNEIRQVIGRRISRLAGSGAACATAPACGDGGNALSAQLSSPQGVAVDGAGNVMIADWGDNEVRVVSVRGTIARLAGNGVACAGAPACGDSGPASAAQLSAPHGVAVTTSGDLYVADIFDHELRLVPGVARSPARAPGGARAPALLAFGASATRGIVSVRFVLSAGAPVSLSVTPARGRPVQVAHAATSPAGLGQLVWDGRLGRRSAARGRYTLTVTARVGGVLIASSLAVSL